MFQERKNYAGRINGRVLRSGCPLYRRVPGKKIEERRKRLQWKNQVLRVAGTKKGGGSRAKRVLLIRAARFPEEGAIITLFLRDAFTRITLQREQPDELGER